MSSAPKLTLVSQFSVGAVRIDPGLLEVAGPRSVCIVEPRVMQVLVTLAKAAGRPVTRDDLIDACWAGRAVSEDAVNRAMAKLRAVLAAVSADGPRLETVRAVGYRLVTALAPAPPAGEMAPAPPAGELAPAAEVEIVPAIDLETRALGAMFEGTAAGTATAIHYLTQAVEEAPAIAPLWGSLAMACILGLPFAEGRVMNVAADARRAALRAQALQPGEGRSLAALASLEPTFGAWAAKERMLLDMLARAPAGTQPLLFQRILFLASVGRLDEAMAMVVPLAAGAPLIPWIQSARAHILAACGAPAEALQAARHAQQRWPGDRLCWFTYFHLSLHLDQIDAALALTRQERIEQMSAAEHDFAAAVAQARAAPTAGSAREIIGREVIARVALGFGTRQTHVEQAIVAAALLGLPDEAMRLIGILYAGHFPDGRGSIAFPKIGLLHPDERNTAILFVAPLQTVRAHPEFGALLQHIDLPRAAGSA